MTAMHNALVSLVLTLNILFPLYIDRSMFTSVSRGSISQSSNFTGNSEQAIDPFHLKVNAYVKKTVYYEHLR